MPTEDTETTLGRRGWQYTWNLGAKPGLTWPHHCGHKPCTCDEPAPGSRGEIGCWSSTWDPNREPETWHGSLSVQYFYYAWLKGYAPRTQFYLMDDDDSDHCYSIGQILSERKLEALVRWFDSQPFWNLSEIYDKLTALGFEKE